MSDFLLQGSGSDVLVGSEVCQTFTITEGHRTAGKFTLPSTPDSDDVVQARVESGPVLKNSACTGGGLPNFRMDGADFIFTDAGVLSGALPPVGMDITVKWLTTAGNDVIIENPEIQISAAYLAGADQLVVHAWLNLNGQTITSPTSCTINVVDKDDVVILSTSSSSPLAAGEFKFTKNSAGLTSENIYRATVTIVNDSKNYTTVEPLIGIDVSSSSGIIHESVKDVLGLVGHNSKQVPSYDSEGRVATMVTTQWTDNTKTTIRKIWTRVNSYFANSQRLSDVDGSEKLNN